MPTSHTTLQHWWSFLPFAFCRASCCVYGSAVAEEHAAVFRADRTQNVIVRLRHNVIRTGLRRINLAYSRIGLADVAAKLGLPDAGDVECIVAKAIRSAEVAVLDKVRIRVTSRFRSMRANSNCTVALVIV